MLFKIILLLSVIIFLIYFIYVRFINTLIIRKFFKSTGIMVCGKRGKGKDTLFSYIAHNKKHNCNIKLNDKTNIISLNEICIPGLSRQLLVNGVKGYCNFEDFQKFDNPTFISDSGIYFPSYDDAQLKKEYPSFAITIAIWRHLYESGCHFNCQVNSRLWKVLREQIEDTIMCLSCKRGLLYTKLKVRYYESPRDAELGLKPLKNNLIRSNSEIKVENSRRWIIKDYTLLIPNRKITHDTRAFKKEVFNEFIQRIS